jgi:glycosyltransferase involved in cell wall biosynthesis
MRVLHIINDLSSGGAQMLLKEALPVMKQSGIEPEVFVLDKRNIYYEQHLLNSGIPVHYSGHPNIFSPLHIAKIRSMLNLNIYDIVHSHNFPSNYWLAIANYKRKYKLPLITTEHSTFNRRRNYRVLKGIESFVYNRYDKIIAISEATRNNLINWAPIVQEKVITIYNGVDIPYYAHATPIPINELIPAHREGNVYILMVARLSIEKDHHTLIKALELLPAFYHVILAGEGELLENIIQFAKERNVRQRVHFLGYRTDVAAIMKAVDVLVLSSHYEGFGLTVIEAMACGLPVIASDVEGLREVVLGAGILFQQGDYKQLANKIEQLLANKSEYDHVAQLCRERVEQFSIERMVSRYVSIYSSV